MPKKARKSVDVEPEIPADIDDPAAYEEAIAAWLELVPMSREEFDALDEDAREYAFTVAQTADADLITDAYEAIEEAIEEGTDFADFLAEVGESLTAAWGDEVANPGARLATIFRTNVQTAYGAGAWEQRTAPAVMEDRPYNRMNAIVDGRTSEYCEPVDGVILPADHPWWLTSWIPRHYSCRTHIDVLSQEEAEAEGITPDPPDVPPMEGFGRAPSGSGLNWTPRLGDYPGPVAGILGDRLSEDTTLAMLKGYDPAQPRVPAGTPEGGEWSGGGTRGGGGNSGSAPTARGGGTAPAVADHIHAAHAAAQPHLAAAMAAIDQVHGDGTLPKIPLKTTNDRDNEAMFVTKSGSGAPSHMELSRHSENPVAALIHETGHFLDKSAFANNGAFGSSVAHREGHTGAMGDLMRALHETPTVKGLHADLKDPAEWKARPYLEYLTKPHEIFARGYAQYIAHRTGDVGLKAVVHAERQESFPTAWHDAEFEPVAKAYDRLFEEKGWRR